MSDDELLAVYDISVHDEYLRQQKVRFAVVPRVHGLRAVADAVCKNERRLVLAEVAAAIRAEDHEPGGVLSVARIQQVLEELA